jgi:hypothetical protein
MKNPNIAIISCGTIIAHIHLPLLARPDDFSVAALIEQNKKVK